MHVCENLPAHYIHVIQVHNYMYSDTTDINYTIKEHTV